jgi:hypothetical protein
MTPSHDISDAQKCPNPQPEDWRASKCFQLVGFCLRCVLSGVVLVVCAHYYAQARALMETVGWRPNATLFGVWLSLWHLALYLGPFAVLCFLHPSLKRHRTSMFRRMPTFVFAAAMGWAVAEVWVMTDEVHFLLEVARNSEEHYTRGRVWPNVGTQLVYIPGRGVHATD